MTAYLVAVGIVALIYMLLAIGLNLQYGYTGLINFGVVAFFAIGAYLGAAHARRLAARAGVRRRDDRRGDRRVSDQSLRCGCPTTTWRW
jgi:ABC-type branched-subunit amino acid transport system permease subunit